MSLLVLIASRLKLGSYGSVGFVRIAVRIARACTALSDPIPHAARGPIMAPARRGRRHISTHGITAVSLLLAGAGHPIVSVYGIRGEGFSNLAHPRVLQVLFCPEGPWHVFLESLLFLATLALLYGAFVTWERMEQAGVVVFMLTILLLASWLAPALGGSFSHRGFVDLYPI